MPNNYQHLLTSDDTFSTTLITLLVDNFGFDALTWAPMTIRLELEDTYKVKTSQFNIDRIMAAIQLLTCNSFYVSLPDFNDLCCVLSGENIMPGILSLADSSSIAWGMTEALILAPPDDSYAHYTPEIVGFISGTLKEEGIITVPDIFKMAGIKSDLMQRINLEFSDDQDMFQAIFEAEKSKTDGINQFVVNRLKHLIDQLGSLHLKNGSTEKITEQLLKLLPEPDKDTGLSDMISM